MLTQDIEGKKEINEKIGESILEHPVRWTGNDISVLTNAIEILERIDKKKIIEIILDIAKKKYIKNEKTIHLIFDSQGMRDLTQALINYLGGKK